MGISAEKQTELKFSILPSSAKKSLDYLAEQKWLEGSNWYLAGGTALALSAGHRKSVDLDFFTQDKDFDNEELINNFTGQKEWLTEINKKNTIYGKLFKTKISFIAYPFFVPKQDYLRFGAIRILKPGDIAVMKIIAISQRGRKRDFFDLFWCAKNILPLEEIIKKLPAQYPSVAHNYQHILKSLVYFADGESDPDPVINFKANWKEVKNYFTREIPAITRKLLKLE